MKRRYTCKVWCSNWLRFHVNAVRLINFILLISSIAFVLTPSEVLAANDTCLAGVHNLSLSLDSVELNLCASFLPRQSIITSDIDDSTRVVTITSRQGTFTELSIIAIPYGTKPSTENLPEARPQSDDIYRVALQHYRKQQRGSPKIGPNANIFGKQIIGSVSVVRLYIKVDAATPVVISEWVTEVGKRIWIIRASQELPKVSVSQGDIDALVRSFENIILSSPDPDHPSVNAPTPSTSSPSTGNGSNNIAIPATTNDLAFPSWWNGDCDTNNYRNKINRNAYPLGGSYRGVKACGPEPIANGVPDVLVNFFSGAWGEYEWECVELVMRYMYLAYGISPYPANGSGVVPLYPGHRLIKINNGTPNKAPQPGDIMSYGATSTFGHTSIVVESHIDGNGNGTIKTLSQNLGVSMGYRTEPVNNWVVVVGNSATGWLHEASNQSCPTAGGIILYWNADYNCDNNSGNSGFVQISSPGSYNISSINGGFNDQASSVRVPAGWSVKLYQNGSSGDRGASACRTSDDDTFWGDKMSDNATNLNDNVSSFEVFNDSRCGINNPPRTPSPQGQNGQGDNYIAHDGRGPTLCWNNPGDPDGDQVAFYAEVYQSAVNANSGWTNNTCWPTIMLDGRYFNYQWHVKARDGRGAESGWSTTWHFTIETPNDPPHVSFDRAKDLDHAKEQDITSNNQIIWGNARNWTFFGSASDTDGTVDHVDILCSGDTCGDRQSQRVGGTTSWSYQWNGLEGLNVISAYAYDNQGARSPESDKRSIILRVDLVAPTTSINLNDQPNPAAWPTYFNLPVQVRLSASDSGTRNAISDISQVYYQIDGQGWQISSASSAAFTVTSDGLHTVRYYAIDRAGNHETEHSVTFKIDRTPPTLPSGAAEIHGVISGQWQKNQPLPTFTWAASSDALSGVAAYQVSFEEEQGSHEVIVAEVPVTSAPTWTPSKPEGMRTGSYRLRVRARDNAGNWSAWADLFVFRYDKTPPENPTNVAHTATITSEIWQRTTNLADFTWSVPHDEGSGISGYYVAWGTDPNATSTTRITESRFQSPTPLCATNAACTGYLRLRSVDNVANLAEKWTTAFVLRYDNAPPTVDFSFAEGSDTIQTRLTLRITATDQGSGVKAMRFSQDGQTWTPWEAYTTEHAWAIPGISRQSWPVYMQVRDGVDLESAVISHTIYLDVNPQQPRSSGYRLFDRDISAGSAAQTSPNYHGHSTVGQVMDSTGMSSGHYAIIGGYEAGSRALPLTVPGYDTYRLMSGSFSSGSDGANAQSSHYHLVSSFGEPALPNNQTEVSSQQYRHQPGFLASVFSGPTLPPQEIGPPPPAEPPLTCLTPQIRINDAALFTDSLSVTLRICAPKATEMMISNDSSLVGAQWEPYAETKIWTLTTNGQYVLPRYVYAAFRDADGTFHGTYFDDVIYDPNPPSGNVTVGGTAPMSQLAGLSNHIALTGSSRSKLVAVLSNQNNGTVDLQLHGIDDNSGINEIQISERGDFVGASWEPYTGPRPWQSTGEDGAKTVYVRFRDSAGNISAPANAQFVLDTQPPLGGIALDRRVVGSETVTTTVYLGAQDLLSGVADMRISTDSSFADAVWQPYTAELADLVWPIKPLAGNQFTLYVQYRDTAGNVSLIYSDTSTVDTKPPVVYAEAAAGTTLTRTLTVLAYDDLSELASMRLSNDPFMIDNVVTDPYAPSVTWAFDDRRVVWVQVQDSVGNWSTPYPVSAGDTKHVYLPIVRQ